MDVVRNMYKGRNVVVVNGEVTARKWEGKDGEKTSLQVKLNSIYDVWMDRHMDSITALKNRIAELEGTETPGKDDIEDDDNPF
jgi:single-stranded DNA-binding protein